MKMLLASQAIMQGKPINAILCINDIWLILSQDEVFSEDKYELENFEIYDEELLYQRIPGVRGKLIEGQETFIFINEKTGEINVNPKHKHLGFSTADMARATNQANVQISLLKYLFNRKKYLLKLGLSTLITLLLCFTISWVFLFYLARFLFYHIVSLLNQRNMCLSGTLNAAVVLQTSPTKIAVLTDLTLGIGDYPVIRVKNVELPNRYLKRGKKIPVAGSYQRVEDQPFWDFFDPIPIPLGAKNNELVETKLKEIPTHDWVTLNKSLKELGTNLKEGYYPIDIETSSWKNIETPKFTSFNEEK